MAFGIDNSVVRGEIDSRVRGIVRGEIWFEGRAEPVALELQGNACPDLAGCLLTFTNPLKRVARPELDLLNSIQRGSIGDLTASRKLRVFDIPLADAFAMIDRGEKPPEHMANYLHLEWFSEYNGRVVIESADYELTISAPEWRLTPEEDEERARQAAAGMDGFMQKLTEAIEQHQRGQKDPETEEWNEHDYEKFMKEADARTDKYMELLEKYGGDDDAEEKIAREMGWHRELTPEEAEEESARIEEMNRICEEALDEPEPEPDPLREGIDWIRTENGDLRHPLQHRCFESSIRFSDLVEEQAPEQSESGEVRNFVFEFQTTGVKLAGALNGIAQDRGTTQGAFTVARLKRALDHLHQSQAGLEAAATKTLLPTQLVADARRELFEIREGILKLMDEFRGR